MRSLFLHQQAWQDSFPDPLPSSPENVGLVRSSQPSPGGSSPAGDTTFWPKCCPRVVVRVLARISKMPVQNSNFKISARPDLTTYLLQILIPATFNSLVCQKEQLILQLCHKRWLVRKIFGYYTPKVKIEKSSEKILPVQTGGF